MRGDVIIGKLKARILVLLLEDFKSASIEITVRIVGGGIDEQVFSNFLLLTQDRSCLALYC